ncbi:ruBisCO large subunit-binding protein subunit beta, chloroplastic-like [Zingiber officinale]|uniref:ruBisCO large subunit-binding protein subunit beta, chloroplastic-like n=1 Tax=Zingiber officinale TaxID=94328 RepID=UPI001C4D156B|nr:ruBisCO large subunit-binding protein subunit beta, chloroplastic-like [Zingiber officinale]
MVMIVVMLGRFIVPGRFWLRKPHIVVVAPWMKLTIYKEVDEPGTLQVVKDAIIVGESRSQIGDETEVTNDPVYDNYGADETAFRGHLAREINLGSFKQTQDTEAIVTDQNCRRNVVLESKYRSPKIVNDGATVAKEVELEDPVENSWCQTNDLAGDGTTVYVVLAQGMIVKGIKVVAAGTNLVQIARGIEKTAKALVGEHKEMSKDVEDSELADVAAVSAGKYYEIRNMIDEAMSKVGRKGVVTFEEGKSAENNLFVVERIAKHLGGVVVIQVGAQTETELEEKLTLA